MLKTSKYISHSTTEAIAASWDGGMFVQYETVLAALGYKAGSYEALEILDIMLNYHNGILAEMTTETGEMRGCYTEEGYSAACDLIADSIIDGKLPTDEMITEAIEAIPGYDSSKTMNPYVKNIITRFVSDFDEFIKDQPIENWLHLVDPQDEFISQGNPAAANMFDWDAYTLTYAGNDVNNPSIAVTIWSEDGGLDVTEWDYDEINCYFLDTWPVATPIKRELADWAKRIAAEYRRQNGLD